MRPRRLTSSLVANKSKAAFRGDGVRTPRARKMPRKAMTGEKLFSIPSNKSGVTIYDEHRFEVS